MLKNGFLTKNFYCKLVIVYYFLCWRRPLDIGAKYLNSFFPSLSWKSLPLGSLSSLFSLLYLYYVLSKMKFYLKTVNIKNKLKSRLPYEANGAFWIIWGSAAQNFSLESLGCGNLLKFMKLVTQWKFLKFRLARWRVWSLWRPQTNFE